MPSPPREPETAYRQIPPVNDLVDSPALAGWARRVPRPLLVAAAQAVLADHRAVLAGGNGTAPVPSREDLALRVAERLEQSERPPLAPLVNATGIILHTGLGRAPLAEPAVEALAAVARGYAPVELDLPAASRGARVSIVRGLLCELTGAESAVVVNNNAAAVMLVLNALARGRTVIVSRGELIEIGGSFRLPEVMEAGGAILREVGTTNRTSLEDYRRAIDPRTAALLKVHPSNYRIEGFATSVPIRALAELGRRHGVPVVHDIGSGALRDLSACGVGGEPVAGASIEAGADLVLFSGDKLLGGPQAGIIVGRRAWIETIEGNPMMRALRLDKLVLAALGVTLQLHREARSAEQRIPVLRMLAAGREELERRGAAIVEALRGARGLESLAVVRTDAFLGGGANPAQAIPSAAVELRPRAGGEEALARRLRTGPRPIVPRVHDGAVHLDLRTIFPGEDRAVAEAVLAALEEG